MLINSEVRWYSLFKMLNNMMILKNEIIEFIQVESKETIASDIWITIKDLYSLVDVVKRTTKALEGEIHSTICYVLHGFHSIYKELHNLSSKTRTFSNAFDKWVIYYNEIVNETRKNWEPLLEVACFLHPGLMHSSLISHHEMVKVIKYLTTNTNEWSELACLSAIKQNSNVNVRRQNIHAYYTLNIEESNLISDLHPDNITERSSSSSSQTGNALLDLMSLINNKEEPQQDNITIHDEINAYRSMCIPGRLEPVSFWSEHSSQLPRLSLIAKKIMSIIPSSAATERQFSVSKRIQGLNRVHMGDDIFQDQVILTSNPDVTEQVYDLIREYETETK